MFRARSASVPRAVPPQFQVPAKQPNDLLTGSPRPPYDVTIQPASRGPPPPLPKNGPVVRNSLYYDVTNHQAPPSRISDVTTLPPISDVTSLPPISDVTPDKVPSNDVIRHPRSPNTINDVIKLNGPASKFFFGRHHHPSDVTIRVPKSDQRPAAKKVARDDVTPQRPNLKIFETTYDDGQRTRQDFEEGREDFKKKTSKKTKKGDKGMVYYTKYDVGSAVQLRRSDERGGARSLGGRSQSHPRMFNQF